MKIENLLVLLFLLNIFGCATAPVSPSLVKPPFGEPGIYHKVERGQTLWRISKMYNADLEEIASVNHISDTTNIEVGQLVFIPRARNQQVAAIQSALEDFIWPVRGRVITSFGQTRNSIINKGLNIAPSGSSEVVASRSGRVVFYTPNFKGYGKTIIIDHGDGFSTVYSRNSEVLVKPGEDVPRGMAIARLGVLGSRGSETYLHFEIRKGHSPQNPNFYLQ